jgi:hypothetical protein
MNKTMMDLAAGSVVPVIHPDTGKCYFLLRINADVPLYGLVGDDEEGEQRMVLSRTIARVIYETWEQAPTGEGEQRPISSRA